MANDGDDYGADQCLGEPGGDEDTHVESARV